MRRLLQYPQEWRCSTWRDAAVLDSIGEAGEAQHIANLSLDLKTLPCKIQRKSSSDSFPKPEALAIGTVAPDWADAFFKARGRAHPKAMRPLSF